jgi:hypothetical protein
MCVRDEKCATGGNEKKAKSDMKTTPTGGGALSLADD